MYLAYIAALTAYGIAPRATLEIPGGVRRLDRITELIGACRYSFHDLSRMEIDPVDPPTPRFNMPFELGPTVTWDRLLPDRHAWFVLESVNRRALKSLSDLAGTDVYVDGGTPGGLDLNNRTVWISDSKTPSGVAEVPLSDIACCAKIPPALISAAVQFGACLPFHL